MYNNAHDALSALDRRIEQHLYVVSNDVFDSTKLRVLAELRTFEFVNTEFISIKLNGVDIIGRLDNHYIRAFLVNWIDEVFQNNIRVKRRLNNHDTDVSVYFSRKTA